MTIEPFPIPDETPQPGPPWVGAEPLCIFMDTILIVDPTLLAFKARITELRRIKCDCTANIMRDELLSQLETWLDAEREEANVRA